MESVFPQWLFLSFVAPTVLRVGAAIVFMIIAKTLYRRRNEIASTRFPLIGTPGILVTWGKIAVTLLIALSLFFGFLAQIGAILGFVVAVKCCFFAKRYPTILPHGRAAYFLLAIICLSLIATGAGGFAFDRPY